MREEAAVYQLQGELPGFNKQDLSLEIVDDRTLVIRGRTESTKTNETAEAAEAVSVVEHDDAKDSVSEKSASSYQKPSAEEEEEYVDAGAESEAAKTPPTATAEVAPAAETKKAAEPSKYWLNERSVGEFERRFNFPGRIELNNVKASLENGILSVAVPKAVKESRRITIE